jgi:hypothetical protein
VTVLIVSVKRDTHAQAVLAALAARAADVEFLDLSEFPLHLRLSIAFGGGRHQFTLRQEGGSVLDLDRISAVWWRRPQPFRLPPGMETTHEHFALSEATTAFQGLYQSLNAFWVNIPARDVTAMHKPYQLTLAQRIGLEIPATLMTNDIEKAREFWDAHDGEVVYKQFLALPETWRETRRLSPGDKALADAIAIAPVIFQRHVPAVADIRVTAVGDRLYAAAADAREANYPQDVRLNPDLKYVAHALPTDIAAQLRQLMNELGLVYGAIDMRLMPNGRYVFLEINPAGQFLYVERDTGQPIAAALAQVLLDGSAGDVDPNQMQTPASRLQASDGRLATPL